jgi:23S rRNA (uracil1939-C5)-methyltransferase
MGNAYTHPKPRRGEDLEVLVERIDARGRARGKATHVTGRYDVVLRRGSPGARVTARVQRRRGEKVEARIVAVLDEGPEAVAPRCPHFGVCGGCSFQDVRYAAQLELKRHMVEQALQDEGHSIEVEASVGCDDPWAYRNKMDFSFSARRWVGEDEPENAPADFALGLHPAGQFHKVLDVEACPIQHEECTAIVQTARRLAREQELAPWHIQRHEGLLRHLVLRRSAATGEILVVLATVEEAAEQVPNYAAALVAAHPSIATVVQSINPHSAQTAIGERELVLHGSGAIHERLSGLEFRLSARSFFQTNTAQAERLVELVRAAVAPRASDVLFDVYCGAGVLGLALARDVHELHGFELVEAAVKDAWQNATHNRILNARFVAGDVVESLNAPGLASPDLVIVDPPRAGLHPKILPALGAMPCRRLVYVSCNPRSAASDVAALAVAGLRLVRAQPVDLFPHTAHVETVLTLEREG